MLKTYISRSFFVLCLLLLNRDAKTQQAVRLPEITPLGSSASIQQITVRFQAGGTVDQVKVVTLGTEGLDFQSAGDNCRPGTYAAGQTCTVKVAFRPTVPGERRGAIVLLDSGKHTLAVQPLAATASGAVATFVPGIITTVAGNSGSFFFAGDGGPATSASLFLPFGVALDAAGDFYIADTFNNRVRVVNAQTGIISTVAGNGVGGFGGDGGPAPSASLDNPSSVQLDAAGDIYIADTANNRIRVVNAATGVITTVAGNGTAAYQGDGGLATSASLNSPNGITFDGAGNLYIADTANDAVRLVNAVTGFITTVAGNGRPGYNDGGPALGATLNNPWAVAVSGTGGFYVADQKNNAIREVSVAGIITTIAGNGSAGNSGDGGPATASRLTQPSGIVIDIAGNIYISDTGNNRIHKINPSTNIITTVAGSGGNVDNNPANQASLYGPYALALDGQGSLLIADAGHNRIRKVSSNLGVLEYPLMRVGSISAPMDQILENDGTATLNISSITAGTNTQVDASTTCAAGVPLAPLAQCTIAADFAPTMTGGIVGTIAIASDALNEPNTLRLQGNVQSTFPATVLLSSTPNPSIVGNGVLFSVQVINSGGTIPTGTVVLMDGTTTIATLNLTNGIVSDTISNLTIGQHTITAAYGGDLNDSSATSLPINQVVNAVPLNSSTTTSLASSSNPITVGQILNLNATVAAVTAGQAVPGGTVAFMEGTTLLGTGTLNAGSASIGISTLTAGTHLITAVYSGSSTYSNSTSAVLTQVVVPLNSGTTTSLTASSDPIAAGATLILTTTVSPVTTGQSLPTGTVSFMEGTTVLGMGVLASGGATFTISTLSVGTHLITAVYVGSTAYTTSTSPVLTEIVVAAGTGNTAQFTLSATPSTLSLPSGSHITLQVAITPVSDFTDTLSFGCGGLPIDSTCTFSQTQVAVTGGKGSTLSVLLDTGNPLDAGPTAELRRPSGLDSAGGTAWGKSAVLACVLPGGVFLALLLGGDRRRRLNLLLLAIAASTLTVLSGCGTNYKVQTTPAGTYTFQIFANGINSGASYTLPVQMTVTK